MIDMISWPVLIGVAVVIIALFVLLKGFALPANYRENLEKRKEVRKKFEEEERRMRQPQLEPEATEENP